MVRRSGPVADDDSERSAGQVPCRPRSLASGRLGRTRWMRPGPKVTAGSKCNGAGVAKGSRRRFAGAKSQAAVPNRRDRRSSSSQYWASAASSRATASAWSTVPRRQAAEPSRTRTSRTVLHACGGKRPLDRTRQPSRQMKALNTAITTTTETEPQRRAVDAARTASARGRERRPSSQPSSAK